jgi:hypothetical protein
VPTKEQQALWPDQLDDCCYLGKHLSENLLIRSRRDARSPVVPRALVDDAVQVEVQVVDVRLRAGVCRQPKGWVPLRQPPVEARHAHAQRHC